MKKLIVAAALGATALSAAALAAQSTPAPAPRTMKADANADGNLSRAEFMAQAEARFTKMDANRDGQISREERRGARAAMRAARPDAKRGMTYGSGDRGAGMMAPPLAPGADAGPLAGMERMAGRGRGAGGGRMLERLDTDKDGRISRAEYDTGIAPMFARAAERGVSRADFDERTGTRFARMDANGDGYVDAAERAAMPQRPMRRGMGGTPPSDA